MLEFDKDTSREKFRSPEEIKLALDKCEGVFKFRVNIDRAMHYSDLSNSYLEAAFIGEKLCQFCEPIQVSKLSEMRYDTVIVFTLKPVDNNELSKFIFQLGQAIEENLDEHEFDFMHEVNLFRDKLHEIEPHFPELIDDYHINFINGAYYEYDLEHYKDFFDIEFSTFPERKYGFFKSAFSSTLKQAFYSSPDSLIIPKGSELKLILKRFSGIQDINFDKADFFIIGNIAYLFSNGFIVHFPFDAFLKAKHCALQALSETDDYYNQEGGWMDGFLSYKRRLAESFIEENYRGYPEDMSHEMTKRDDSNIFHSMFFPFNSFYLSSYGDHILVEDSNFAYFFYGADKLNLHELSFLGNNLSRLFAVTAALAGFNIDIKCPWENLNEDLFEDLCFDIIYHNPKFDNSTIRKIGKTKSRDGGRDITVLTHSRPGNPAKKFIFQCKYLKPGSSLTGSKVQDISDTVVKHDAHGYGIMTNVIIDATLYDKLDGIARTLKVEIEDFSIYKLERILSGHPQIKSRYFPVSLIDKK